MIFTTNTVEGFNRQLRKVTKSKGAFPNEKALLKMIYLGSMDIQKKWTTKLSNWALCIQALAIYFEGRLELELDLRKTK